MPFEVADRLGVLRTPNLLIYYSNILFWSHKLECFGDVYTRENVGKRVCEPWPNDAFCYRVQLVNHQ